MKRLLITLCVAIGIVQSVTLCASDDVDDRIANLIPKIYAAAERADAVINTPVGQFGPLKAAVVGMFTGFTAGISSKYLARDVQRQIPTSIGDWLQRHRRVSGLSRFATPVSAIAAGLLGERMQENLSTSVRNQHKAVRDLKVRLRQLTNRVREYQELNPAPLHKCMWRFMRHPFSSQTRLDADMQYLLDDGENMPYNKMRELLAHKIKPAKTSSDIGSKIAATTGAIAGFLITR